MPSNPSPWISYDAARVDGANRWQEFVNVTLPGIRPTVVFMLLMTCIWSFLVFSWVYILTKGGPAGSSNVLGVMVFNEAFQKYDARLCRRHRADDELLCPAFLLCCVTFLRKRGWEI